MDFYVYREGFHENLITGERTQRVGWTGPISSEEQAGREAAAWTAVGWTAVVHPDTVEVRARLAAWEESRVDGWRDSTDPTQRRRWHEREEIRREAEYAEEEHCG
jgi:hypothetical protein